MPNVMATQPNIGGALCKSSVIPFLVPRRKVWLTPDAGVPCSNAENIGERKTLGRKVNFATGKIPSGGNSPQKCIYSAAAQEMAKHRAKFGWPPVTDIAAVTKQEAKPVEICWGVPNFRTVLTR